MKMRYFSKLGFETKKKVGDFKKQKRTDSKPKIIQRNSPTNLRKGSTRIRPCIYKRHEKNIMIYS